MVNRAQYVKEKESELLELIHQPKLNNFIKQILAKKMGAEFNSTYDERYLWQQAIYLSSKATIVLEGDINNLNAIEAMRLSGYIYEILSNISKDYDRGFCLVLAAMCYEIAGYQANAQCLLRERYELNEDIEESCYLLIIQLFLQKRIKAMYQVAMNEINDKDTKYTDNDILVRFFVMIRDIGKQILEGTSEYDKYVGNNAYIMNEISYLNNAFIEEGNLLLSRLNSLLKLRYKLLEKRGIWNVLGERGKLNQDIWIRYAKLLTNNGNKKIDQRELDDDKSIIEFWNSQLRAIEQGILDDSDLNSWICQMPTSAGKTMVAELCILNALVNEPNKKCIYIAPYKALVNEVELGLCKSLGSLGYVISGVSGNFELDNIEVSRIDNSDVLILTPEKLNLLLRTDSGELGEVSLVVIDEGHLIGNEDERAIKFEMLMIRLKRKMKNVKFLFISAVINEESARQLAIWLTNSQERVLTSPKDIKKRPWQPTRRYLCAFEWKGNNNGTIFIKNMRMADVDNTSFVPNVIIQNEYISYTPVRKKAKKIYFPNIECKNEIAVELAYKYAEEAPVLIFSSTPPYVKSIAKAFLRLFELRGDTLKECFNERVGGYSYEIAKRWLGESSDITKCLKRGIGVHYSTLPQSLRRAIEKDFKEKRLKVLISTTTLGQGVNLPIKTVIVHSLVINYSESKFVSKRDFWNIIGRAGRAGRETEGEIIFLSNKSNLDRELIQEYMDENNNEQLESALYVSMQKLVQKRITENDWNEYITKLLEPELMALLVEEIIDTPDERYIEEVLNESLCKIQAVNMDNTRLKAIALNASTNFYSRVTDRKKQKIYAKTGLGLKSCEMIASYIEDNLKQIKKVVRQGDYLSYIVDDVFECISDIPEMKSIRGEVRRLGIKDNKEFIAKIIKMWVCGEEIEEIRNLWILYKETYSIENLNTFIEELLVYKYPWGVSAFGTILSYYLDEDTDAFPEDIKNAPIFMKNGLNDVYSCFAKELGTPTRESSKLVGEYFYKTHSRYNLRNFMNMFIGLSYSELRYSIGIIEEWELKAILDRQQFYNLDNFVNTKKASILTYIKGIRYENRIVVAKKLGEGDIVFLEREYANKYDRNAILIKKDTEVVGYVDRYVAKQLAADIDLGDRMYRGRIKKIIDLYTIEVEITAVV